jgi:hypothetical protein
LFAAAHVVLLMQIGAVASAEEARSASATATVRFISEQ